MTRRAILFLQLGGPERLSEVRGFLYRLFSDPEVIRVKSVLLRKTIAASIAITRSGTSKKMYEKIGGGSPIRRLTDEQSAGVKRLLRDSRRDTEIETAMMCSSPLVEEVVEGLARKGVDRFLAFPLYPQYSLTTTKGALDRSRQAVARFAPNARLFEMGSFPAHPLFLEAHAEQIREQLDRFPDRSPGATLILVSAHSIRRSTESRRSSTSGREPSSPTNRSSAPSNGSVPRPPIGSWSLGERAKNRSSSCRSPS